MPESSSTKKVYSIWIFFNPPQKDSNTITEYSLEKKDTYGKPVKGWNHDYISIVFIRLSSIPGVNSQHQLISMLDTLFSNKLSTAEKKTILEQEHQMKMTRQLEGGTNLMCNLSDGIYNQGIEQGIQQGIEKSIELLKEFVRAGMISAFEAASRLKMSIEEFQMQLDKE